MDIAPIAFEPPLMDRAAILAQAAHYPRAERGIYFLLQAGRFVHVGHSTNVCQRVHKIAKEGRLGFDQVAVVYTDARGLARMVERYAAALIPEGGPAEQGLLSRADVAARFGVPQKVVDACCAASGKKRLLTFLNPSQDGEIFKLVEWISAQGEALASHRILSESTIRAWIDQFRKDAEFSIPRFSFGVDDEDRNLFGESDYSPEDLERVAEREANRRPSDDEDLFA